jgi:diaminopimelate epimerase
MDYVNADGSLAEMCGNGARVYARYLVDAGWSPPGRITLRTRGGARFVEVPEDAAADIAVDMGPPIIEPGSFTAGTAGERFDGMKVSMGNPHLVCPVDDPARLDLSRAPTFAAADFPDGVNVEFYARTPEGLVMRVYERGSGETMSCGTGACAVAVAEAAARGARETDTPVDVPGGRLRVVWEGPTVMLHGPAHIVAVGRWCG